MKSIGYACYILLCFPGGIAITEPASEAQLKFVILLHVKQTCSTMISCMYIYMYK